MMISSGPGLKDLATGLSLRKVFKILNGLIFQSRCITFYWKILPATFIYKIDGWWLEPLSLKMMICKTENPQ